LDIPVTNKRKIVNDPVYGFINIESELFFDVIEHPWFQRLRRIRQLGLTSMVYPGANHTRFQHALGALHLMQQAVAVIRSKGHEISDAEAEAVCLAILLHDIGHGPFSHALEHSLIENNNHEKLSEWLMDGLNQTFDGKLSLAIDIFKNKYTKPFLHQLISSQLDMDRLDYLLRDSFFTGVAEGVVGSERIIKMLNVHDGNLVVEAKGIYSIEKFLIARRLMYWQVYLHKTVLSAENLLVKILQRAKELALNGDKLFATPALDFFLNHRFDEKVDANLQQQIIEQFVLLDDTDVLASLKVWMKHSDPLLAKLCQNCTNRKLYKIEIQNDPFTAEQINAKKALVMQQFGVSENVVNYLVVDGNISNNMYDVHDSRITILYNDGRITDLSEASDILGYDVVLKAITKYYMCYPKEIVKK
jgi:uncharacterized protein